MNIDTKVSKIYLIIFLILALLIAMVLQLKENRKVYAENATVESQKPKLTFEVNFRSYYLLDIPNEADGQFKAYMDYRTIRDKTSKQWYLQQLCYTDELGFRRFNGNYVVAVGTGYADRIGQELIITLSGGVIFTAIVGDIKQDRHTDINNQYVPQNGNIVEFVVDTLEMDHTIILNGCISGLDMFGKIIGLEKKE